MFSLDGIPSDFANEAKRLIDGVGYKLELDPKSEKSFTLVLYRLDPLDKYRYLCAHSGLREPESMFGPWARISFQAVSSKPRSFQYREGIARDAFKTIPIGRARPTGELWISGRQNADWADWKNVASDLLPKLHELFDARSSESKPPYPELWFEERKARDSLRTAARALGPWPQMQQVCQELTRKLGQVFYRLFDGEGEIRIGIYLFSGDDWQLCGVPGMADLLPGSVPLGQQKSADAVGSGSHSARRGFHWFLNRQLAEDSENAFEWVHRSGSPVLLMKSLSEPWQRRVLNCNLVVPDPGGVCISPIRDPFEHSLALGLLVLSVEDSNRLGPAHGFLINRLSLSLTSYITRRMPLPGYPWWPRAKLERGGARVKVDRAARDDSEERYKQLVECAENLMPMGSKVTLKPLGYGLTGSDVAQLLVQDEKRLIEIPRVLKIGSAELIGDELYRYFRYAHNKKVGGHSRVDVACGYPTRKWEVSSSESSEKDRESDGTAAIVYTLVGPEEEAESWSTWARSVALKKVEHGIELLMRQLSCWHERTRQDPRSLAEIVVTPEILSKQKKRLDQEPPRDRLKAPNIEETIQKLEEIRIQHLRDLSLDHTCVVHGDPHCDNVFAFTDGKGSIQGVALIDWGKVQSDSHPLTDVSILLADLMFRMHDGKPRAVAWGEKQLYDRWRGTYSEHEATCVIAVHLLRMLAWRFRDGKSWLKAEPRTRAWKWLCRQLTEKAAASS